MAGVPFIPACIQKNHYLCGPAHRVLRLDPRYVLRPSSLCCSFCLESKPILPYFTSVWLYFSSPHEWLLLTGNAAHVTFSEQVVRALAGPRNETIRAQLVESDLGYRRRQTPDRCLSRTLVSTGNGVLLWLFLRLRVLPVVEIARFGSFFHCSPMDIPHRITWLLALYLDSAHSSILKVRLTRPVAISMAMRLPSPLPFGNVIGAEGDCGRVGSLHRCRHAGFRRYVGFSVELDHSRSFLPLPLCLRVPILLLYCVYLLLFC